MKARSILHQALRLAYYQVVETFRQPMYLVSTLLFPPMFFWFFAVPNIKSVEAARFMMGSFACFAFLGVVLFQFGVMIAQERGSRWYVTLRALPVHPFSILLARLIGGLPFGLLAVGGVILTAHATVDVGLPTDRWLPFLVGVVLGGLPFAVLGLLIGVVATPKTALPLANLIYLPLSFGGGLWLPPNALPSSLESVSKFLPTRFYGDIVWAQIGGGPIAERSLWGLALYFSVGLVAAFYFFLRDEGEKFS